MASLVAVGLAQGCGDSAEPGDGGSNDAGAAGAPDAVAGSSRGGDGTSPLGGGAGGADAPPTGGGEAPIANGGAAATDTNGAAGAAGGGGEPQAGGAGGAGFSNCEPIPASVKIHVDRMQKEGWAALNAQQPSYGCGEAAGRACFATKLRAKSTIYGGAWEADGGDAVLRVLRQNAYVSNYAAAVSPDGRFVAHGSAGAGATIVDLNRDTLVSVVAEYLPGFFPDGSGFSFQGGSKNFCGMTELTSNPTALTMNEPSCSKLGGVGLANHVAKQLPDGDYLSVNGLFESDDGGRTATLEDPTANFDAGAKIGVVPIAYNGSTFVAKPSVTLATPNEGDFTISRSGELLLSRVAGESGKQAGYRLRALVGSPPTQAPILTTYCVNGGTADFSYDERWVAFHHYVTADDAVELGFSGSSDPDFKPYLEQGASNIYLLDVTTGETRRVTRMQPSQYAVYPQFRADGWLYFVVRTLGSTAEQIVASDAALAANSN